MVSNDNNTTGPADKTTEKERELESIERQKLSFTEDFMRRIRKVKTTRWIRFIIVSILFCAFVVWLGNPWVGLLWLLLLDIYITCYIPWTWWKSKKGPVRTIMGWVDAIVYALVLVYILFAFVGQNYKIPSSSLEKSLLVGDYLWVSKVLYGPRVPQTPLHFPLAQHTLPVLNTKSYIEKPQLKYHRLAGLRSVERGDIVVFNFPEGDTVLSRMPEQDYYLISDQLRRKGVADPAAFIRNNPNTYGKIITRPVDRRENYVKRAIGLPGEWLEIRNDSIFIDGVHMQDPEHVQFNYIIPVSAPIPPEEWQRLGVRTEDAGGAPVGPEYTGYSFYTVPLTAEKVREVQKLPQMSGPLRRESESGLYDLGGIFPLGAPYSWTRVNMGKFWIPKKGVSLRLTDNNLPLYRRAIETYEGNKLERRADGIYINGKRTDRYTFKMDYYWMMGDNRDRSLDSRYWGFVPEDHVVGSPMIILTSLDEEKGLFDGKIRFGRTLRNPNPDKSAGHPGWNKGESK